MGIYGDFHADLAIRGSQIRKPFNSVIFNWSELGLSTVWSALIDHGPHNLKIPHRLSTSEISSIRRVRTTLVNHNPVEMCFFVISKSENPKYT